MQYTVLRQKRKSIGLYVLADGGLEVRAPRGCTEAEIERCVRRHEDWLEARRAQLRKAEQMQSHAPQTLRLMGENWPVCAQQKRAVRLDMAQKVFFVPEGVPLRELMPALSACYAQAARSFLPMRTAELAKEFGLKPTGVRITGAAKRWGSCSSKGAIHFSWRLMMASPSAVDSVIIHELMHLIELNHSPAFRKLEQTHTPDAAKCKAELAALAADLMCEGWL